MCTRWIFLPKGFIRTRHPFDRNRWPPFAGISTRFSLAKKEDEILKEFQGKRYHPLYETYKQHLYIPKYNIPHLAFCHVITNIEPDVIQLFRWGYVPANSISPNVEFYNYLTRSEEMFEKKTYSEAARTRRCLVLADGFVEWDKREKPPIPYRFTLDQKLFAFAGIWDTWISKDESVSLNTFSILTTSPNSIYVHKRMPVILNKEEQESYLFEKDKEKVLEISNSYLSTLMDYYELTNQINSPDNDTPGAIAKKLDQEGQLGLF